MFPIVYQLLEIWHRGVFGPKKEMRWMDDIVDSFRLLHKYFGMLACHWFIIRPVDNPFISATLPLAVPNL